MKFTRLAVCIALIGSSSLQAAGDVATLATVSVSDTREAQIARKEASVQKIVIAEDEIERFGDATVGDILKRLPGTSFTGPAGVTKDIRMRGLDKGYTQFYINDEPAPGATKDRQMQVDRLPADMIERIEIIRNPSAEYDSGSVGGIINIVFKQKVDGITRLRASAGRNGSLEVGDFIVQSSRKFDNLDVLLALSYTKGAEDVIEEKTTFDPATGAVKGREYKPKPVDKTELLFTPRFTWNLGSDRFTLDPYLSRGTEDKTERNTVSNTTGVTGRVATTEDKEDSVGRIGGRYDGQRDWGRFHVKFGLQETAATKDKTTYTGSYNAGSGAFTGAKRASETERLWESVNYLGAGVVVPLWQGHRVSTGLEVRQSDFGSRKPKTEQSISAAGVAGAIKTTTGVRDRFDIGESRVIAYLQDEIQLASRHWLTPGVRHEQTSRDAVGGDGVGRSATTHAGNPSLHYRWAIRDDLNFRSSLARTLKLPKFDQLNPLIETKAGSTSDPDKGGNPDLAPEKALGFEAGFEKFFWNNRGIVGMNFYNRDVQDYIEERYRLEPVGTTNRYVKRPYNVGDAHFWGVELDWRFPIRMGRMHSLSLFGNHSEMRGRIKSPANGTIDVKEMPQRVTNLGLDYRHVPTHINAGVSVNFTPAFDRRSTNDDGAVEEKHWGERTGLDVYVGKVFGPLTELRLVAKNLLALRKEEETIKRNALGAVSSHEFKIEKSRPTVFLTYEGRF